MITGNTKVSKAVELVQPIAKTYSLNVQGNIKDLQKAVKIYNNKNRR